jgi:hypothetical protein
MQRVSERVAVDAIHFTDPSCPWAYSAEPLFRTPERRVERWLNFRRRFGMPVLPEPRSRLISSGRACRAIVAARAESVELGDARLRRIRLAWFTSTLLLDEDEGIASVAAQVPGLDVERVLARIGDPEVEAAYQADRAETRSAATVGRPAIAQGRTATSDGPERFTAPSVVFRSAGRSLVAGGWQSLRAYDVCIANLEPDLPPRAAPGVSEALAAFPATSGSARVRDRRGRPA